MVKALKRQRSQQDYPEGERVCKRANATVNSQYALGESDYVDHQDQGVREDSIREPEKDFNQIVIQQKLDTALDKIRTMSQEITYLVSQVGDLKTEMQALKASINNRILTDDSSNNATSNESSTVDSPQTSSQISKRGLFGTPEGNAALNNNNNKGPFPKYEPTDRVVPRPSTKELANTAGGKSHSLQFTCSLYVDLITKVLGPSSETGLDYKAMVKESILITKAVLSHIKEINHIDPDLRWSRLDPTIKLEAYRKLEAATEHLLPLKVCSEFWGAHVLISNFWLKRKKKKTANNSKFTKDSPLPSPSLPTIPATDATDATDATTTTTTNRQQTSKRQKPNAFSIPFLTNQ